MISASTAIEITYSSKARLRLRDRFRVIYIGYCIFVAARQGESSVEIPRKYGRKSIKRWLETQDFECTYGYSEDGYNVLRVSWANATPDP